MSVTQSHACPFNTLSSSLPVERERLPKYRSQWQRDHEWISLISGSEYITRQTVQFILSFSAGVEDAVIFTDQTFCPVYDLMFLILNIIDAAVLRDGTI